MALQGQFPRWNQEVWPEAPGLGTGFLGLFLGGEGRERALIGPAVTVALKAQAFSPGFYLIVAGPYLEHSFPRGGWELSHDRREAESSVFPSKGSVYLHLSGYDHFLKAAWAEIQGKCWNVVQKVFLYFMFQFNINRKTRTMQWLYKPRSRLGGRPSVTLGSDLTGSFCEEHLE